jgi:hypothetical protein
LKRIAEGRTASGTLVDRVIKMHKLVGLKSKVYIDDMREWSGW